MKYETSKVPHPVLIHGGRVQRKKTDDARYFIKRLILFPMDMPMINFEFC